MIAALLFALKQSPSAAATPAPSSALLGNPAPTPPEVDLRDIAPPVDFFPYPLWQVVLAAVLALLVLALLAWLVWSIWPQKAPPVPITPRQRALKALERLKARLHELAPREFSFEVSEVLRRYVEEVFRFPALEQTTPEFLASVGRVASFGAGDRELLQRFCERTDVIKYAGDLATPEDSAAMLESAFAFIQGGRL